MGGPLADILDVVVVREIEGRISLSNAGSGDNSVSATMPDVFLSLAVSFFRANSLWRSRTSMSTGVENTSSAASSEVSGVVGKLSQDAEWNVALDVTEVVVVNCGPVVTAWDRTFVGEPGGEGGT